MQTQTLERALATHPFLADLGQEHLHFLTSCVKNARFERDAYLMHEGEPAVSLFLIREGRVALESQVPGRGSVQVETLESGAVLGWSALFPPHYWHLDGRAVEPVLAFELDGECLRKKIEGDKEFGYAITRRLLHVVHRRLERARLQQLDVYKAELQ
jgi:CRP/FNR family transcriptional regulator, cyclic AMP receptor protein